MVLAVADHLKDKEPDIRKQALQTHSFIDTKGYSVVAIGEALVEDAGLRRPAIEVLEVFGEKAKPALPQLLQSVKEYPEIRFLAAEGVAQDRPGRQDCDAGALDCIEGQKTKYAGGSDRIPRSPGAGSSRCSSALDGGVEESCR